MRKRPDIKTGYRGTLKERLLRRVICDITTQCWNFTGYVGKTGYGLIGVGTAKMSPSHRESYKLFVGPIPERFDVHHTCNNRRCVNPKHLQALSRSSHLSATTKWAGNWTHCKRGHLLAPDNLVQAHLRKTGGRLCRQCVLDQRRRFYAANKDKWKTYAEANRERINAKQRARYAADPERFAGYMRKHRAKKRLSRCAT